VFYIIWILGLGFRVCTTNLQASKYYYCDRNVRIINRAGGQWRLARPDRPRAGYHLSYVTGVVQKAGFSPFNPRQFKHSVIVYRKVR